MRRYWCAVFAVVVGVSAIGGSVSAGVWNEDTESLKVQSVTSTDVPTAVEDCPTFFALVDVESVGRKRACIGGGPRSVAIYYENNRYYVTASASPGGKRSLVEGVCTQGITCLYSADTDTIIERHFGAYYTKYIVASRAFSDQISWQFLQEKGRWGWLYENPGANRMLVDAGQTPFPVETVGLSSNGRWLAAELREKGIVLIDLRDNAVRRITDSGYLYGRGMDPLHEYAVADDGSALIVTGHNSGFSFYKITSDCGAPYDQTQATVFATSVLRCPNVTTGVSTAVTGSYLYNNPRFNQLSRQFSVVARLQYGGSRQITAGLDVAPGVVDYLALGDSFASGQGETSDAFYRAGTNEPFEKCHVSTRSYAYLLEIPSTHNIACSGAQIPDILSSSAYSGQGERLKDFLPERQFDTAKAEALREFIPGRTSQLDFVKKYQPSAVTVSVGGNDIGLMDKLRSCVGPGTCDWAKDENKGKTAKEIQAVSVRLTEVYAQIRAASPKTKVYVIGYPDVIRTEGVCDMMTGALLNDEERRYLSQTVEYLSRAVMEAADSAGVYRVDLGSVFGEHALCGGEKGKAMNGLRWGNDGAPIAALPELRIIGDESFHPTPLGHELIAAEIRQQTDMLRRDTCTDRCGMSIDVSEPPSDWLVTPHMPRAVKIGVTKSVLDVSERSIGITLPAHLFAGHSAVGVLVGDDPTTTHFQVDARGVLSENLSLNQPLTPGYHTLRVVGETGDAESIEVYQQIFVGDKTAVSAPPVVPSEVVEPSTPKTPSITQTSETASLSPTPNETIVPVAISGLLSTPANPVLIASSASVKLPIQPSVNGRHNDIPQVSERAVEKISTFTAVMIVVMGIIGTCLVFVLLLRK